jgi:hypothetical protein
MPFAKLDAIKPTTMAAGGSSSESEVRMNANQMNSGRGYWLAWFLASVMGFGMGAVLGTGFSYGPLFRGMPESLLGTITGMVMGGLGSYFQWVVLRERISGVGLWTVAGMLGFGLALGAMDVIGSADHFAVLGIFTVVALFGLGGGTLQWLILRRKVAHAGWWLVASCLGCLIGILDFPFVIALGEAGKWTQAILTFGLVFGAGYGAITGATMVWLLRQSPASNIEGLAAAP